MERKTTGTGKAGGPTGRGGKPATDRDARLKAALKANLGRRKAQARARADGETRDAAEGTGPQAEED